MAVIPVNMEDQVIEEQDGQREDMPKGVELLAQMFIPSPDGSFFVPNPNIAGMFDNDTLMRVGRQVKEGYEADLDSMTDWSELVDFGLELAKQETNARSEPWDGAANFKSPELMKASLKFSDRASTELLRGYEILKTKVIGADPNNQKFDRGERVSEFQNYQLNVEMEGWRDEHEKLIYDIPYTGTVFKKTFFDAQLGRPDSKLIVYPNFAVNQDAESISRLRRFSEIHEFSANEVIERQRQGLWLSDAPIDLGAREDEGSSESESDKITSFIEQQGFFDLDNDGYEEPYTFVIQESTGVVVRIMPRFEPKDVLIKDPASFRVGTLQDLIVLDELSDEDSSREIVRIEAESNITKYGFLRDPQGGFLDVGYTHLLSALVSGINTTTNQLVDAGTLSNLQGGWLAKGFRRKMGSSSFKPGEWKQTGISAIDLQNGVKPLPFKEPSPTLFQLMQFMIANAQDLAASTDLKVSLGTNSPVGTTLALIDEQMQGTGAIVKRIYRAMSSEFKKLYRLNSKFVDPSQYQEVLDDPNADFAQDFNIRGMDIVPVANPEVATKTQRVIMAQAELSQIQNILFAGGDVRPLIKNFFEIIGSNIVDEVFPEETPDQILQRLLSENPDLQALITGEQERLDLIAAAQADAVQREQARKDAELFSKISKEESETELNEAKIIKTLEEAESEDLNNQVSTYTEAAKIDALEMKNQLTAQELNNGINQAGFAGVEQPPRNPGSI